MARGDILRVAEDEARQEEAPERYIELLREIAILSETRDLSNEDVERYLLQVALQTFKANFYDWVKRRASGYVYDGLVDWSMDMNLWEDLLDGDTDLGPVIEASEGVMYEVLDQLTRSHYVIDVQTAGLVMAVSDVGEGGVIQHVMELGQSVPTEISGVDGWAGECVIEEVVQQVNAYATEAVDWLEERAAEVDPDAGDVFPENPRKWIDLWYHDLQVSEGWIREEG